MTKMTVDDVISCRLRLAGAFPFGHPWAYQCDSLCDLAMQALRSQVIIDDLCVTLLDIIQEAEIIDEEVLSKNPGGPRFVNKPAAARAVYNRVIGMSNG